MVGGVCYSQDELGECYITHRGPVSKPFFESEFPSTVEAMGPTLDRALKALAARGWVDASQEFYAHLCLEEALVNAITHGNQGEADRKVLLRMAEDGDRCVIQVFDEGRGFRVDEVRLAETDQHGGRGICLIKFCMEEVYYDREENCLVMKMRRNTLSKQGSVEQ